MWFVFKLIILSQKKKKIIKMRKRSHVKHQYKRYIALKHQQVDMLNMSRVKILI